VKNQSILSKSGSLCILLICGDGSSLTQGRWRNGSRIMLVSSYRRWLRDGGIKLAFNLSSTRHMYTWVHLCAPTTYAKKDKQLCDSKIYNFEHQSYHKVKYISKELKYRNNRGTKRQRFIPKFTLLGVLLCVGAVLRHDDPKHHNVSLYSPRAIPSKGKSSINVEPRWWSPYPYKLGAISTI
jgi:hypothetical protein